MTSVAREVKKALNESNRFGDTEEDWEPEYIELRKEIEAARNDLYRAENHIAKKYGFESIWGLKRAIGNLNTMHTHYKEARENFIEDVNKCKKENEYFFNQEDY